jgi:hypothetical protein
MVGGLRAAAASIFLSYRSIFPSLKSRAGFVSSEMIFYFRSTAPVVLYSPQQIQNDMGNQTDVCNQGKDHLLY